MTNPASYTVTVSMLGHSYVKVSERSWEEVLEWVVFAAQRLPNASISVTNVLGPSRKPYWDGLTAEERSQVRRALENARR